MAANIAMSTSGNYVAGTTVVSDGQVIYYDATLGDTLLFPLLAPIGFKVLVIQNGTGTVTIGAAAGASVTGNTTLVATGVGVWVVKVSSTAWVACVAE